MYAPFFGLRHEPFSIAPDPRFLFMSERHREALAHLLYGLKSGGGFVLLTGEIGAGKTTVCRCFLEQIPKRCNVAYIFNPKLTVHELLKSVCEEFRIPDSRGPGTTLSIKDYVDALNNFLLRTHAVGQNNVLIIDEAQNLSADVLEQLRLLTNLETNERKLLQVVLIGQPELRAMLARPELEQLAQRVIARYHLDALTERETRQYVAHRLGVAGMSRAIPFDASAMRRIHQLSRGVPRRINLLCDRALLGAYARGKATIDRKVIDRAAEEVFDAARAPLRRSLSQYVSPYAGVGVGMVVGATLLGIAAWALGSWTRPTAPATITPTKHAQPVAASRGASGASAAAAASASLPPASVPADGTIAWDAALRDEDAAWRALASVWGLPPMDSEPCHAAQKSQIQCYRSAASSMATVRQLDRPMVLTLHDPSDERPAYALLVGLSGEAATLAMGTRRQVISLAALAGVWRGEFATFWRSPPGRDASGGDFRPGHVARAWVSAQLDRLPAESLAHSVPREDIKGRVAAFQLAQGLKPDGVVGPITLMQLNRAVGVDEPRLRH